MMEDFDQSAAASWEIQEHLTEVSTCIKLYIVASRRHRRIFVDSVNGRITAFLSRRFFYIFLFFKGFESKPNMKSVYLLGVSILVAVNTVAALKEGECEVCITTVKKFANTLSDDTKKDHKKIEGEFKKFCKGTKSKENRFCYYIGGLEESATGILGELSKPLSWSLPAEKICEKLKKMDAQICDLRFEKQIDLNTVDLKKLKVRDLKKILNDWDETCDGCIEKSDFISRIEELKPKYSRSSKSEL